MKTRFNNGKYLVVLSFNYITIVHFVIGFANETHTAASISSRSNYDLRALILTS